MPIYTRTGDKGETSLYGGKRVKKSHALVEAYGSIDELMASKRIFYEGKIIEKPVAKTAIVVETPTIGVALASRVTAHRNIIRSVKDLWRLAGGKE